MQIPLLAMERKIWRVSEGVSERACGDFHSILLPFSVPFSVGEEVVSCRAISRRMNGALFVFRRETRPEWKFHSVIARRCVGF